MRRRIKWVVKLLWLSIWIGMLCPHSTLAQLGTQWAGKTVSIQGEAHVRRAGESEWQAIDRNDLIYPWDQVRVLKNSRAGILLPNESLLRIDQNTTIKFSKPMGQCYSQIEITRGVGHFFSRMPRSLKVLTPFVNGNVEGTEFVVRVSDKRTNFSVLQGKITVWNAAGEATLTDGQSTEVGTGVPPMVELTVSPRDTIQWALYYPLILDYSVKDFSANVKNASWGSLQKSLTSYAQGEISTALMVAVRIPNKIEEPRFFTYRAGLYLWAGRVEKALDNIEQALTLDPAHAPAVALQAMIAVVQNHKEKALELARTAAELDPSSPVPLLALAYAYQAKFDIKQALQTMRSAAKIAPDNALILARLAELWLSEGNLDNALKAARKAFALQPNLERIQTILGYAYLTQVNTKAAKSAFEKAIALDQAAPLPRLGLGLAIIRDGNLEDGRQEIEIAASLSPNNSLIRSYLGKAFFDEKRDQLSANQLSLAKALDPNDPTPWFYDAIRKQSINRPVEALKDIEKSIALNNNRAVFRSKLLLDQDLAARSASLASIYSNLGFQFRSLVEGWSAVNSDPANFSAHRFLADSYALFPRHQIARVSELLQSQLLQPLNINPIQPHLSESDLYIFNRQGPTIASFNEFNPLFNRNRIALRANGVAGDNQTLGNEIALSGVQGKASFSVGQFHYKSDGVRENNDQRQTIYNGYGQVSLAPNTSVQAEYRYREFDHGDLFLLFDQESYLSNLREEEHAHFMRLGLHHTFTPASDLLVNLSTNRDDFEQPDIIEIGDNSYGGEAQFLYRLSKFKAIAGIGYFEQKYEFKDIIFDEIFTSENNIDHANGYIYTYTRYPNTITWTLGSSFDAFSGGLIDKNQFNPKCGLTWNLRSSTILRAAWFRTLKRTLLSSQTIEPTQVAGFNQLFDDGETTDAWRYGIGLDQKLSTLLYAGAEYSRRDLETPGEIFNPITGTLKTETFNLDEEMGRAYLYWTPHHWVALNCEYLYEKFKHPIDFLADDLFTELQTHQISLGLSFFHPSGIILNAASTYVDQNGTFGTGDLFGTTYKGDDQFWIVNATVSYRLPKRYGIFTLEANNLLDQGFHFQSTDPANPSFYPERMIMAKINLAF